MSRLSSGFQESRSFKKWKWQGSAGFLRRVHLSTVSPIKVIPARHLRPSDMKTTYLVQFHSPTVLLKQLAVLGWRQRKIDVLWDDCSQMVRAAARFMPLLVCLSDVFGASFRWRFLRWNTQFQDNVRRPERSSYTNKSVFLRENLVVWPEGVLSNWRGKDAVNVNVNNKPGDC